MQGNVCDMVETEVKPRRKAVADVATGRGSRCRSRTDGVLVEQPGVEAEPRGRLEPCD